MKEANKKTAVFSVGGLILATAFLMRYITSNNLDDLYLAGGAGIMTAFAFVFSKKSNYMSQKQKNVLLLLMVAVVISSLPLFTDFVYFGHDVRYHVGRLEAVAVSLQEGQFPVRLYSGVLNGYGSLTPLFYPDVFLYPAALLHTWGLGLTRSYQFLLLYINVFTIGIAYYSFSRLFKNSKTGLYAAVIYSLAPYRLVNLYTRAAVGEVLAMVFLPLILLGMYEVFFGDDKKWPLLVLGFGGVLLSHILSFGLAVLYSSLFCLLFIKKLFLEKKVIPILKAAVVTIFCTLFFLGPFLGAMQMETNLDSMTRNLAAHSVYVGQLLGINFSGTGPSSVYADTNVDMNFSIGLPILIGLVLLFSMKKNFNRKDQTLLTVLLMFGLSSLFIASNIFPWTTISEWGSFGEAISMLQFPWRFIVFGNLFLAPTAAYAYAAYFSNHNWQHAAMLVVSLIVFVSAGMQVTNFMNNTKTFYANEEIVDGGNFTIGIDYLPEGTEIPPMNESDRELIYSQEVASSSLEKEGLTYTFSYEAESPSSTPLAVEVPLLNLPGYEVYTSSGENVEKLNGNNNSMKLVLPEEKDEIIIQFMGMTWWKVCEWISLVSILIVGGYLYVKSKK